MREIELEIAGLGIILYSPPAVANIVEGSDYLQTHFWQPEDVARHVMSGELTTFCTGSSGSYVIRFLDGPPSDNSVENAEYKLRLGLWVREQTICIRDLYDLKDWVKECQPEQQLAVADGWYRLTVLSTRPASGITGDNQVVRIHMEPIRTIPELRWEGVPQLCDQDDG